MNVFRWLENMWNLRKILDKYLPMLRQMYYEIKALRAEIEAQKATEKAKETTETEGVEIDITDEHSAGLTPEE